jgi:hypothetical protein
MHRSHFCMMLELVRKAWNWFHVKHFWNHSKKRKFDGMSGPDPLKSKTSCVFPTSTIT